MDRQPPSPSPHPGTPREVFTTFLKLGCTAFGGPIAHLGYFQREFVVRRRWIDDHAYADFVALCQFLPGPTSSQVGLALGWKRAGWRGALAAWVAFAAPSAILMFLFACGIARAGNLANAGWVSGLKIAAAAVVFQAVIAMARKLCPDLPRAAIAIAATAALLLWPFSWMQLAVLALGALLGLTFTPRATVGPALAPGPSSSFPQPQTVSPTSPLLPPLSTRTLSTKTLSSSSPQPQTENRKTETSSSSPSIPSFPSSSPFFLFFAFFTLHFALPWLARLFPIPALQVFSSFYRTGSLVFGGGHVVLPLLEKATVGQGWIDHNTFLAGYGAAQALPGPLFTFSVYLGALIPPGGLFGAVLALIAIYLPTVFLVFGTLPHWERLRAAPSARALLAYVALEFLRAPPWLVVLACALTGQITLS